METFIADQGLFWQYPVITEKTFYEQNKDDVDYVGIPWATVLDKRYDVKQLAEKLVPLLEGKVYYTCCQHISFRKLLPLFRYLNIKTVFSPHMIFIIVEIKVCPLYAVNVEDVSQKVVFKCKLRIDPVVCIGGQKFTVQKLFKKYSGLRRDTNSETI